MDSVKWGMYLNLFKDDIAPSPENRRGMLEKTEFLLKVLNRALQVEKPLILEVGCAEGFSLTMFKSVVPKFTNVVGVTYNREYLESSKKYNGIKIICCDMHDFPFKSGTFDAIYCSQTLEHSLSPLIAICEFNRVLKNGGVLLLDMPEVSEGFMRCPTHHYVLNEKQLNYLATKLGFRVIETSVTSYKTYYSIFIKHKNIINECPVIIRLK